ncbi:MAG: 23S rRNA (adenine(2030)-N(6))-methyltransferase RlmJ [Bradyrhizobiaceae bacterium]|nr:23S rRNA (adenine(2030)-N(6))-methyltransferase RlmJ [Bradyrhizobiaceae bacterium]
MNYRHAFHAGNFADVVKHIVMIRILTRLREKTTPFRVIDTHAGDGLYDLSAAEPTRTGEWCEGIGRLAGARLPPPVAELVAPYLAAVHACNHPGELRYYPGSPVLARHLLRAQDRLVACEIEPRAAAALSRHLSGSAVAKVTAIDGWVALKAYVPPKERRGLVIVDPPFEQPDDFIRLADGVAAAWRKWQHGIYLLWYPVKDSNDSGRFIRRLRRAAVEKCLRIEFAAAAPRPDGALTACGLLIVNPPWKLAAEVATMAPALTAVLGRDRDSRCTVEEL